MSTTTVRLCKHVALRNMCSSHANVVLTVKAGTIDAVLAAKRARVLDEACGALRIIFLIGTGLLPCVEVVGVGSADSDTSAVDALVSVLRARVDSAVMSQLACEALCLVCINGALVISCCCCASHSCTSSISHACWVLVERCLGTCE